MYTNFFGLNEKPFAITPDPRYLFMSERHSEGLAHLVYGVKDSSGFIQLTGEVGTGKTTLVRTLLTRIPNGVDIALILNPQLSALEFLTSICEELKIELPPDRDSKKAIVDTLNKHLLTSHAEGRRTILVIDEAQNLATGVLEQIRLLTNLETSKQKLLQIILIAQPELRDKLKQTNLRQLAQRVTGRYHLEPLTKDETVQYIDHRLKVAGALTEVFDDRSKREVFRLSGGVPRLVNVICDRALLGAYSQGERRVLPQTVRKAAAEISGELGGRTVMDWLLPVAGVLTAGVVVAGIWAMSKSPNDVRPESVIMPIAVAPEPTKQADPRMVESAVDSAVAAETMPQVVTPQVQQTSLNDTLLNPAVQAPETTAALTLLSIWGVDYDSNGGTPCSQAERSGLMCFDNRGSWGLLKQLDRPAILTLTDSGGQTHPAVLTAINDNVAELQIGDHRGQFSVSELADSWYGQYRMIWKPPNGDASVLRPGVRGPKVLWLRQSLQALVPDAAGDRLPDPDLPDLFDAELENKLRQFQRRNRLQVDGHAGQQTQIMINTLLGMDETPSLSGS